MKKFIIITSIFEPTEAVEKFAALEDWQLIVVGDKKTKQGWQYENVIYLSPEDQEKLNYPIVSELPWNSYGRKMIGYLYAINHGADVIADTDDDNIPYDNWGKNISWEGEFDSIDQNDFVNMYKLFTPEHIWPRGYPLNKIMTPQSVSLKKEKQKVGIWQFLADEDPDVDAIYRLTNNKPVFFEKRSPIILEKNTFSPFNSQNTIFTKELFPLLYLPAFVTFRYTDILRGLIAQPIMWTKNYKLGFDNATVIQKRNPHNYLKDFESEIPCFLYPEKVVSLASSVVKESDSIEKNMLTIYTELQKEHIVDESEIILLKHWLKNFS